MMSRWYINDLHLLTISRYAKPRVTVLLSGEGGDGRWADTCVINSTISDAVKCCTARPPWLGSVLPLMVACGS
jgi:hypothetical protein